MVAGSGWRRLALIIIIILVASSPQIRFATPAEKTSSPSIWSRLKEDYAKRKRQAIEEHYLQGINFYREGKLEDAIEEWEIVLELDSQHRNAQALMEVAKSRLNEAQSKRSPSKKGFLNSLGNFLGPGREKSIAERYKQGLAYYQESKLNEALSSWNEILKLDPYHEGAKEGIERIKEEEDSTKDQTYPFSDSVKLFYNQGMKYYRKGKYPEALAEWKKAIELNPNHQKSKEFIKRVAFILQERERKEKFDKHHAQGETFYREGRLSEAIREWEKALELEPSNLNLEARLKEVRELYERKKREEIQGHLDKGITLYKLGNLQEAINEWEFVLEMDPNNKKVAELIALAKRELENRNKEKDLSSKLQGKLEEHFKQGLAFYEEGKLKEAISEWREVLKLDPNHRKTQEYIAKAYSALSETKEEGERRRKKAQEHYRLGLICYQQGKLEEAIIEWRQALELDPKLEKARKNIEKVERELKGK